MTIALYTIAAEHRAMVEALINSQDDAQAIADTIDAESYTLEVKAQQVAYAPRILEAEADAIEAAAKEMLARAKSKRNRADAIREYLKTCLEVAGVSKIECPHFAITIQKNPPSVDVFEPSLVPAEFMRQAAPPPPTIDKTAIKEAIKAGREVPGAMLQQATRLVIK
jgi:hypothetical protein